MRAGPFIVMLALAVLAACARAPQPVTLYATTNPPKLSDWGVVFRSGGHVVLNVDVEPYELATPLFSDYAAKLRTVWLPPGSAAKYDAENAFDFPVGTVLSKTFYYPRTGTGVAKAARVTGELPTRLDPGAVRLIETRLLVRRADGWHALPYVWNDAQTDATLARTGALVPLELVDGDTRTPFTYVVPDENQCASCHGVDVESKRLAPIGPKARHLNRDVVVADTHEDQLARWTRLGLLRDAPAPLDTPKTADWQDERVPVAERARAYLDINCAHCHSAAGPANTTALHLDHQASADVRLGLCKPPVAAGRGTGNRLYDIVPGRPQDSILAFRMASSEPGVMMPELGRSLAHREGVALIEAWIAAWPGECG